MINLWNFFVFPKCQTREIQVFLKRMRKKPKWNTNGNWNGNHFEKKWSFKRSEIIVKWLSGEFADSTFTIFIDFQLPLSTQRSCCVCCEICENFAESTRNSFNCFIREKGERRCGAEKTLNFIHKSPERTNICFVNAIDGWFSLPKLAQRETTNSSEFWIEIRIRIKAKFPSGTLFHLTRITSILFLRHCCEKARKHAFSLYTSSICKRVIACSREDETKISSNWRVLSTIPEGYENKFRNFQKTSFEMVRTASGSWGAKLYRRGKSAVENYVDGESWSFFFFALHHLPHLSDHLQQLKNFLEQ